jgi:hypothetical protein
VSVRYVSAAETAKIIRAELKKRWPKAKFSVRSKTYTGGGSINIDWVDGPALAEVERIAKRFEGASFDSMQDLKSYHDSTYNGERVHWGADYVFCNRKYTADVMNAAVEKIAGNWALDEPLRVEVYGEKVRHASIPYNRAYECARRAVYEYLNETDF